MTRTFCIKIQLVDYLCFPGLKVFDFHPIHLYLNTENLVEIWKVKSDLNNKALLDQNINHNNFGVRNFLNSLLENVKMKIGIIGRTEILYKTCLILEENGYDIQLLITSKEAPEYKKTISDFVPFSRFNCEFINTSQINNDLIMYLVLTDIGVSMNYVNVISKEVISSFRLGI